MATGPYGVNYGVVDAVRKLRRLRRELFLAEGPCAEEVRLDQGFEACRYIIDTLKAKVPIWKKEIYQDSATWKANKEWLGPEASAEPSAR
ncbi:unnamed protein product [Effrenium voratum]|nr:unnamed protein product [Effrenium voratum]